MADQTCIFMHLRYTLDIISTCCSNVRRAFKKFAENATIFLFCKSAELNYRSYMDKHYLYVYSKFCCSDMKTMLTVVAMETVHHDYQPTFVHFCKKSMFNDDVAFDSFTKLYMSKVQYVCGENMASYKCDVIWAYSGHIV